MIYLVPTPIGHLADMTFRAVQTLREVDWIAAEDTRQTVKLLRHYQIEARMVSLHQHNEHQKIPTLLDTIKAKGETMAYVTDAGMPGISDPGFLIVREAIARQITVVPLPGPTAVIPAIVGSGLPCDRFVFEGFLPAQKGRKTRILALESETRTMVFYESPHRIRNTLQGLAEVLGPERQACIAREISKLHEEFLRGTLAELMSHYEIHTPKASTYWWSLVARKPWQVLMGAGLLMAAAFPPIPLPLLTFLGFLPLLSIIELENSPMNPHATTPHRLTGGQFFRRSYVFFLVWNLLTCYWLMMTALSVETMGEKIEAFTAGFLAVTLNPILQSLPMLAYRWIRRRWKRGVALGAWCAFWLCFEYAHFNWDLSWSWITLGHAFTLFPAYIQYIEWTGVLGISLHVLVMNALLFELVCRMAANSYQLQEAQANVVSTNAPSEWKLLTGILLGLLLLPLGLFPILTSDNRSIYQSTAALNVRVIQPNIDPYKRFRPAERMPQIYSFVELAKRPPQGIVGKPELVLLPEAALPAGVWYDNLFGDEQMVPLLQYVSESKVDLITGLICRRVIGPNEPLSESAQSFTDSPDQYYETYNAAIRVGDTILYKKAKMVPMVERAPFLKLSAELQFLSIKLGEYFGNFGLPDSIIALRLSNPSILIAPIICYESEFGNHVRQVVKAGAMVNCIMTNDGWFGNSSGHVQHAQLSVLRAIETRRYLARSANTGVSLFCTPTGVVTQELGWWKKGVLDQRLPLLTGQTLYVQWGDWLGLLAFWTSLCIGILGLMGIGGRVSSHSSND